LWRQFSVRHKECTLCTASRLVLLFLAIVTGTLCLALTLLVQRTRSISPPRAIMIAAVIIGMAPFVTLALFKLAAR